MRLVSPAALRTAVALALAAGVQAAPAVRAAAPALSPAAAPTSTTASVDLGSTARLHDAADDVRRDAGLDPLFRRGAYVTNADRIATAVMNGSTPAPPGDNAPMAYLAGTTTALTYDLAVADATAAVVRASHEVLRYPMHTDGGWSVVSKRLADGRIRYGVALVVGWPNPNVAKTSGCSAAGYCWSNGGLNPHLPWTRNTVKWYLSTSNLPSAGESLLKSAIAKLNAVPGFGAHVVYGGKTTVTGPTSTRRFVVVFGSGCSGTGALGCTITSQQGTYKMVFQAKTIVTLSRYRANPSTTWWTGTLMHELGHGMGLGHYDSTYNGSYQLMRWADGPDTIKSGDMNGLRDHRGLRPRRPDREQRPRRRPGGAYAVHRRGRRLADRRPGRRHLGHPLHRAQGRDVRPAEGRVPLVPRDRAEQDRHVHHAARHRHRLT
jgi:hypothetical protein